MKRWAVVALAVVGVAGCTHGSPTRHARQARQALPTALSKAASPALPAASDGGRAGAPDRLAHDCSADVTVALSQWIASVPDGSTVELQRRGCYRLDGTLVLKNRHRLVVDGNGATLRAGAEAGRDRRHVSISGGADVTVRDLTVQGANAHAGARPEAYRPDRAFQHAFAIFGAQRVLLERVSAHDLFGDFVWVGPDGPDAATDVTIRDSTFRRSGRQGISIVAADRVRVSGCTIADVARSLFDIEPNTPNRGVHDVQLVGNTTGAARNFWLANKGAGNDIHNVVVADNVMTEGTGGLVFAYGKGEGTRGPYVFVDNRLRAGDTVTDENTSGAFVFGHVHDVAITGNDIVFATDRLPLLDLIGASTVRAHDNALRGAGALVHADEQSSEIDVKP